MCFRIKGVPMHIRSVARKSDKPFIVSIVKKESMDKYMYRELPDRTSSQIE